MKKLLLIIGTVSMTLMLSSCFCSHWDDAYYHGHGPSYHGPGPGHGYHHGR